jgi:hypothetical protein
MADDPLGNVSSVNHLLTPARDHQKRRVQICKPIVQRGCGRRRAGG